MPFAVTDIGSAGSARTKLTCLRKLFMKMLSGALAIAVVTAGVTTSAMAVELKRFENPKVGGKYLDGCYRWPGECRSTRQAEAFCKRKGYPYVYDFSISNKVGVFQAKRLGDGGTCTASCSVMSMVYCERY